MMELVTGGSGSGKSAYAEDRICALYEEYRKTGKKEQKLYYIRNPQNYGTIYGDVLAENVSGFNVDISKARTEGVLRFQLSMTKRGEKITQTYTMALRNQLGKES